jgi:hypothetical protein
MHAIHSSRLSGLALLALCLSGCLTNTPDPALGGVYACAVQEDCPGTQSCLQQVCEAIELPMVNIFSPEDGKPYTFVDGATLTETLSVSATNLAVRGLAESSDAVPGEGHVVVYVDEVLVATIDSGNLSSGVQMEIEIPNTPGVHRIRAQARLNDGTDYDNPDATARNLVWVDDGNKHVALRKPWPGDKFPLEQQLIDAEVAIFDPAGEIMIGPPQSNLNHVHVFYDEPFPSCMADPPCLARYNGIVPDDTNDFGPVLLPEAAAGPAILTALIMESDHTMYEIAENVGIFSDIEILRTND